MIGISLFLLLLFPCQDLLALKIIAHRGNSSVAPENTLPAFHSAVEVGADLIECDIQIAADGTPVIVHDDDYQRTAGHGAAIGELSAAEVSSLDAGAWFAESFAGTRVPTLADAVTAVQPSGGWMLELKGNSCVSRDNVLRIVEAIESHQLCPSRFHVGSMSVAALEHLHALRPQWSLIAIVEPGKNSVGAFEHLDPAIYALRGDLVEAAVVREIQQRGKECWVWTVDDIEEAKACCSLGVDGLITNTPERMRVLL